MIDHDPYTRPPRSAHTITILGGTGFVGSHLVHRLSDDGHRINVLSRNREAHRELLVHPSVEVYTTDVHDAESLARHFEQSEVVINLVGILNEKQHNGEGFQRAHVDFTRNAADTARRCGVRRFLQMSALGADRESPSHYQRTKAEAEDYLLGECAGELDVTVFRPSIIFGAGQNFTTRFANLVKLMPGVFPLACAETRFAPVYVNDVVEAYARCLDRPASFGRHYELCGPEIYTLREIVEYIAEHMHRKRVVLPLPDALGKLQAAVMEYLPGKPFSLDNYRSTLNDNICTGTNGLDELGIHPTHMDAVVPFQLASNDPLARKRSKLDKRRPHGRL